MYYPMRVVSLFSGAGGLDVGLRISGCDIVWANDVDADAVDTYKANIGEHVVLGDICSIKSKDIPDCDLVVGGFPCQGFSQANRFRESGDERNRLYLELLRVIRDKQPKWFIAENVKGLLSLGGGSVFKRIEADFFKAGYRLKTKVVNMADHGLPQTRVRVIMLGTRRDLPAELDATHPAETHSRRAEDGLKPWIPISAALAAVQSARAELGSLPNDKASEYKVTYRNFTGHRKTDSAKPCPTILARGDGGGGVCAIPHPNGKRRLTVRESAYMQGFPVCFEFAGALNSQYRQVGNAVPVEYGRRLGVMLRGLERKLKTSGIDQDKRPTVVSLFSGAGGMDVGFTRAGFDVVFANDFDPAAVKSYRQNVGEHIIPGDITAISDDKFPAADVVVGGFPCQGFSHANTGRRAADPRNMLYRQYLRALKVVKPKYFVAENVKGILSLEGGRIFKKIKADFAACGYECTHAVLNAADYGAPQVRERVFIIGTRKDLGEIPSFPPEATHARDGVDGKTPWLSVSRALRCLPLPLPECPIPNHQTYSFFKLKFNGYLGNRRIDPDKPAPTVTARGDTRGGVVVLHHPSNKRRMSVRELATVQGFPLDFEFCGNQSDAYRQIGNAVPPPLAEAVARCLLALKPRPESSPEATESKVAEDLLVTA